MKRYRIDIFDQYERFVSRRYVVSLDIEKTKEEIREEFDFPVLMECLEVK